MKFNVRVLQQVSIRISTLSIAALLFSTAPAAAQTYEVRVTNVTRGQIFGPPAVLVHNKNYSLYTLGAPASTELALIAEDADSQPLLAKASGDLNVLKAVAGDGPIMPGATQSITVKSRGGHRWISLATMLVTTNDAFAGLDAVRLPSARQKSVSVLAWAYDSGSESNTETCATIPGPPCGNGGIRHTEQAEGYVHLHSGIHGIGDLPAEEADWRGPVAQVTITMTSRK